MLIGLILTHALLAGTPGADPGVVRWTVPAPLAGSVLAELWGLPVGRLAALNPGVDFSGPARPGDKLVVYGGEDLARSVGHPADGRLRNGRPMPEGEGWTLRYRRRRTYGSTRTVVGLVEALRVWRRLHPEAPPIAVGELSRRRGGELPPHKSHQSGRDVDVGYAYRRLAPPADPDRFRLATGGGFDPAATWDLIRALDETGDVERIFVSARLLPALGAAAREHPAGADLRRFFRAENPDYATPVLLVHAPGHRDHMHVRFRCSPGQDRCRGRRPVGGG